MTATTPTPAAPRRFRRGKDRPFSAGAVGENNRDAWLLVLPALLPVILFSLYPLLRGIYLGFTDATSARNSTNSFNGVENYRRLWRNDLFRDSFKTGAIWTLSVTTLQFVLSLCLALLLNMNLKLRWLARTLSLVPWAMPPVIVAVMWRLMYDVRSGPVNDFTGLFGVDPKNWLIDGTWALPAVIVVAVWSGMPQTTVTLLAGLQQVDGAQHEAAAIDGAGTWKRFRHVTLPAIAPTVVAITTLDVISNFNSFGLVYALTVDAPNAQTRLPALYAYDAAFRDGNFGLAAAMGNVMVIVIALFLIVYLRSQARHTRIAR